MKVSSFLRALPLLLFALSAFAGTPDAQKLSRVHYEDLHNGFRFKAPDDWTVIPLQSDQMDRGVTCRMEGSGKIMTFSGRTYQIKPSLIVLRFEHPDPEANPEPSVEEDGDEAVLEPEQKIPLLHFLLTVLLSGVHIADFDNPKVDKKVKARKKLVGRHRTWIGKSGVVEMLVDTFEFQLEDADVYLIYSVANKVGKKWTRTFSSSGKSFEVIERERVLRFEKGGTYDDIIQYHEELVSRTPGWKVVPTPSQRYLIKTSSDNRKFIDEVIERLELSRDLFERDFPPLTPISDVSVVRICGTEEEFHSYGGTSGGVGGWFSPGTEELVLFDYRDTDRNATYAVMSHEAFHQYCHFMFDRSEAHRWFDEGHGDYYGGVRFSRGKAKVTPKMPAGFDRLSVIKGMVQRDEQVALSRHLNFSHREWQRQGPSNVSCYAQSWSIIYMLRKGAIGEVSRKYWKKEYATIIPNYMTALSREFKLAYARIIEVRETLAGFEERELTEEERSVDSDDLEEEELQKIWKSAMAESWGKIDLEEFEANWLGFVRKQL